MLTTTTKIWKLRKTVYSLVDTNLTWYLKILVELIKLGEVVSKVDQGIFYWKEKSKLKGIAIFFVAYLIWTGNKSFEEIIVKLKKHSKLVQKTSNRSNILEFTLT